MKTITIIMVGFLLTAFGAQAQDAGRQEVDTNKYFEEVEEPPELIGGVAELAKHMKYPEDAAKEGIQGTVLVSAYVGVSGSIDAVKVKRSPHDLLSQAALDAVWDVRFTPGRQDGKAVPTVVMVPVRFRLK